MVELRSGGGEAQRGMRGDRDVVVGRVVVKVLDRAMDRVQMLWGPAVGGHWSWWSVGVMGG